MGVSDLVTRFPLVRLIIVSPEHERSYTAAKVWDSLRLFPLQGGEIRLDGVILVELGLDIVI